MKAEVFLISNNVRNKSSNAMFGDLKDKIEELVPEMSVNAAIEVETVEENIISEQDIIRIDRQH